VTAHALNLVVTVDEWRARIAATWAQTVECIIETGKLLEQAKAALPHGEFQSMIRRDLPFGPSSAGKIMVVAGKFSNRSPNPHLPASWTILYRLSLLSDDAIAEGIRTGAIHPKMTRVDAFRLVPAHPQRDGRRNRDRNRSLTTPGMPVAVRTESPGPTLSIPNGKTAEQFTRDAMAMQAAENLSAEQVAKRIGIRALAYRQLRCLVMLRDRTDLRQRDAELVFRVLTEVNETNRITKPFETVRPLVDLIFGARQTFVSAEARRLNAFEDSFSALMHVCNCAALMEVPYLSVERTWKAVQELRTAEKALRELKRKLSGRMSDG
jgi:DUF3102 family protein